LINSDIIVANITGGVDLHRHSAGLRRKLRRGEVQESDVEDALTRLIRSHGKDHPICHALEVLVLQQHRDDKARTPSNVSDRTLLLSIHQEILYLKEHLCRT
jgi:hypothetical protein